MNCHQYVVRIVKPADKPNLPSCDLPLNSDRGRRRTSLGRHANIMIGSGIGIAAGTVIYLMLRSAGISFGGIESLVIIGFPSALSAFASFAIH